MDMQPPEKASAAEAAGWQARMRGERDVRGLSAEEAAGVIAAAIRDPSNH